MQSCRLLVPRSGHTNQITRDILSTQQKIAKLKMNLKAWTTPQKLVKKQLLDVWRGHKSKESEFHCRDRQAHHILLLRVYMSQNSTQL